MIPQSDFGTCVCTLDLTRSGRSGKVVSYLGLFLPATVVIPSERRSRCCGRVSGFSCVAWWLAHSLSASTSGESGPVSLQHSASS